MPYADPAVRRAYHRAWKQRNRGRYAERQKATDAARHANKRAAGYGALGRITIDEAANILAVGECFWCGAVESDPWWTLDHIDPLHLGGTNRPRNIRCSCHSCNASKFRTERPYRWSRKYDACVDCGTTERKHTARGRCNRCYKRAAQNGKLS